MLVFIIEMAMKAPIKQAPLSPKKNCAFGKLNLRKVRIIKPAQIKIKANSQFSVSKFIIYKIIKMIKECIDNRPLKPSIKLEPLIINKKHKEIKNSAKMSISKSSFKNFKPVFSI